MREQGIRVPEDISVTGFDNIKRSEYCYPPLTTVHIPRNQVGQMVFEGLVAGSDPNSHGREMVMDQELVLREFTGAAAGRCSHRKRSGPCG
ncbi:MAG: substrate-binding domain-containing protein [Acidobacteriia bacterium]|nr:substrate-binding domain-containing protein [Terriglobia bacterium]